MDWQEISVKTTEELADAISNIFYDLGAGGVVMEDPKAYQGYIESGQWDYHSISDELLSRDYIVVKGYLPINEELLLKEEELQNRLAALGRLFPCTLIDVSAAKVKEEDWAHSWKAYYKPHKIGKIVVKPTWEDYSSNPEELLIELDPGMAFGTGTHPTTEMVLALLQEYVSSSSTVADVGTGSGVLAVAAAKLGAKKVYALDIDPVAVKTAKENVLQNGVSELIEVDRSDLLADFDKKVNIISANIVADIIIRLFDDLERVLEPGGILIASGIIKDRLQDVITASEKYQLQCIEQKTSGDWVAVCFKR